MHTDWSAAIMNAVACSAVASPHVARHCVALCALPGAVAVEANHCLTLSAAENNQLSSVGGHRLANPAFFQPINFSKKQLYKL